jgi:glycosyltransferase involved in cell wall biosynthesis
LRDAHSCVADGIKLAADVQKISGRDCRFLPSSRSFGPPGRRTPNPTPPYRLAFLGRWHPNKGPDLLLGALAGLTQPEWSRIEAVRICGGGPMQAKIRNQVELLAHAGHPVHLGGFLDHAAAYELFEWADYVIIPSRVESIPVVFSDAMQIRRPVITMPVGDLPGLLSNYGCGIAADEVSVSGLTRALGHALSTSPRQFAPGLEAAADAFDLRSAAAACLAALNN